MIPFMASSSSSCGVERIDHRGSATWIIGVVKEPPDILLRSEESHSGSVLTGQFGTCRRAFSPQTLTMPK